jgi:microsomal dipeptidase-like Zn-dependent dipeptidase
MHKFNIMASSFIDLHCHPSLKPYGKSFKLNKTKTKNSPDPLCEYSVWFQQKPKLFRKVLNVFFQLTKWRQSDFSSMVSANSKVVVVSLYPLEKGMVVHDTTADVKFFGKLLRNLATGISMRRVRHLQQMKDYFEDLENEYKYFTQLHNTTTTLAGHEKKFVLIKSSTEIDFAAKDTLYVLLSIEGAHVFNCGLQLEGQPIPDEVEVLQNVEKVKNWEFRPFFIGLAHHFDNQLCGFSKSFSGIVAKMIRQFPDPEQGLTPLGIKVLDRLLDNSEGKRILIDLKHMNPKSRYEYYDYLKAHFPDETIPLIVSHGALNGKLHPFTHNYVSKKGFNVADINFFFDELLKIEASKGIFGIQLDERRIFDVETKNEIYKKAKANMTRYGRPKMRKNTFFIWRQIESIGVYLDTLNKNAWDIQALGTDYDGIINPLNGLWTVTELQDIEPYLIQHAKDFLKSDRGQQLKPKNQLSAETIIEKFMTTNARNFVERHF